MGKKKKKNKQSSKPNTNIIAYTDGGCLFNPGGPGGYGVVIINKEAGEVSEYSEGYISTTNNRMEVKAVLHALQETSESTEPVTIVSDSQYAINCAIGLWQRNKNRDLWKEYEKLTKGRDIRFNWVRGHSGNQYNERCDELATIAMQSEDKREDKGYLETKRLGREYYERMEKHEEFSRKMSGGAMGVKIDIPDNLDKEPDLCSVKDYSEKYHVKDSCARAIRDFYLEGVTSFKAYAKLKTGGVDFWSRKSEKVLSENIGDEVMASIKPYFDEKQALACAKWICRGLKPSDAVRKVLVDAEISANCLNAK